MAAFFAKYNTQTDFYFPLIKRGTMDFAVSGDYTHSSGDVKVSKDGGAAATASNAPSAITMGNGAMWKLTLTATELSAAQIVVTFVDAATKAIEDQMLIIHTYGNASAYILFDLSVATQAVNATSIGGTAQTGRDLGASVLLSSGTGAGQLDFTSGVVKANLAQILGTALTETAGQIAAAFKKFFDIASPTSTMNVITLVTTTTTATTATNLTNAPTNGDLTATMKASVNAEVVDGLAVDTYAEPGQGAPAATATLAAKINYLYKAWRNKKTQTATTFSLFADDASTVDQKATVSDDGTTFSSGEVATGP